MILISDFITIVGIIISFIFILYLIKSKGKGTDKTLLTLMFFFIFFTCLHTYASLHSIPLILYVSYLFDYTLIWILGPLLMVYVKSLFHDQTQIIKRNSLHFLPAIIITVVVFIPKLWREIGGSTFSYLEFYQEHQRYFLVLRNTYFLMYLIFTAKSFLSLKKNVLLKLDISLNDFSWIQKLLLGSAVFVVIDTSIRIFEMSIGLPFDGGYITLFAIVIFIAYLGYNGLNESRIMIPHFLNQQTKLNQVLFSNEETLFLEKRIKSVLEKDKLYLDESLTLKQLSEVLQMSEKKLSSFLNQHLDTKFKDYINFYRVEEVKRKLKSKGYDSYTLLGIAEDSGFNSKASFYRIFKKHTGLSPSEYKKRHQKE